MNKRITNENLAKYRWSYMNLQNKQEEKKLQTASLLDVCLNEKVKEENTFFFSFELEECKIYNQYESMLCWLYSCLNLIKNDMAHNLQISPLDFELSAQYLNFYDKLEKAHHAYQVVAECGINLADKVISNFEEVYFLSQFLKEPMRETGRIEYARALLNKYGIVPSGVMPSTYHLVHSAELIKVYAKKVKGDIFTLIDSLSQGKKVDNLIDKMCEENYILLSKLLGNPPTHFDYTYTDKKGKMCTLSSMTPQDFFRKYCTIELDEFVVVGNVPMKDKLYYTKYQKAYSGNVHGESAIEFINLPQEEFTNVCLAQLLDGCPVPIACENKQYRNRESTILDTRLFDFEKVLGVKDLTKEQALDSCDITLKHWMTLRGVDIQRGLPIKWKVEDTGGSAVRNHGYYVMNHKFFEKCVFQAFIHKKYLSKKVSNLITSKPVLFGYDEPI